MNYEIVSKIVSKTEMAVPDALFKAANTNGIGGSSTRDCVIGVNLEADCGKLKASAGDDAP